MTNFIGRNVSSTCNSSGSALWASAKNIKSLVDANFHTEAIAFANHRSPIRFSPIRFSPIPLSLIYYKKPEFEPRFPSGQTILFGCSLELRTIGKLEKIPPVLDHLLISIRDWPRYPHTHKGYTVSYKGGESWPLVNEIEQAWTGVEEYDRDFISNFDQDKLRLLILVRLL